MGNFGNDNSPVEWRGYELRIFPAGEYRLLHTSIIHANCLDARDRVFVVPSNIEPMFWLAVLLFSGVFIARAQSERQFLHGLLVGIVNSVWRLQANFGK
jgi:hypothetical protein